MKKLLFFAAFFLIAVLVFVACRKEHKNQPPVADAGKDTSLTLSSCLEGSAELNGSGSTDSEGKIITYLWIKISGPEGIVIKNPSSAKTTVENLSPGEYVFELTVTDAGYLYAKDKIQISVKAPPPKEYDFDVTVNSTYIFVRNASDFYSCFYYQVCSYHDRTEINGTGTFQPLGEFTIHFLEEADTAVNAYASHSDLQIFQDNINGTSLMGTTTVNFKKLIQQGGGNFNGTFTVTEGSAKKCNPNVFSNLPPLNITGSLNVTTRSVTLRIYGKTYF